MAYTEQYPDCNPHTDDPTFDDTRLDWDARGFHSPSLQKQVLSLKQSVADHDELQWRIRKNCFGFPKKEIPQFEAIIDRVIQVFTRHFLQEPQLGNIVRVLSRRMETELPNLVSFNSSLVDQTAWERVSQAEVVDNGRAVEVDLLPLVRDLMAHLNINTYTGTAFLENYPDFTDNLWTLDRYFILMGSGLPRWFPFPGLIPGHLARRRLNDACLSFVTALDALTEGKDTDPQWLDLSDVSQALIDEQSCMRSAGISPQGRAAQILGTTWAMNANSDSLVFWILLRILREPGLVDRLRAETAPFASATQPAQLFGIPEPPRLKLDINALWTRCPLLRSCYMETLRLDSSPWSVKTVHRDFELIESADEAGGAKPETFRISKGQYVEVAFDLHNTDPQYFDQPRKWIPERHIKVSEPADGQPAGTGPGTTEWGTLRVYGGGKSMCKGRFFAEKECLAFVAGMLVLWDFEPVGAQEWKLPKQTKMTAVVAPKGNIRARIRRRNLVVSEK
ncbi:cytochrome P450 [Patellaria atrata CBS 101060]|uniref:Cytochrome P450 n=1 Tax=Patellaria atrata CBS 101060 TaxID=1346257 RepID=A0A9P4SFM4_9PEZI|nr:cytochrome P450 [Patellaria atrata CBS 101060]